MLIPGRQRQSLPPGAWTPAVGRQTGTTYAIAQDLSEVIETEDGFGIFPTRAAAVERWISLLEDERDTTRERLRRAKRLRRQLKRQGTPS
jgi:hypothetical protein